MASSTMRGARNGASVLVTNWCTWDLSVVATMTLVGAVCLALLGAVPEVWAVVVFGFLAFALTLEVLGWILAAALLFWAVARGFGSRRPLFDISLALLVSSAIYLAFTVGLGLTLPSGILGGGF